MIGNTNLSDVGIATALDIEVNVVESIRQKLKK